MPTPKPRYKRILLKLSGEALMGERNNGVDPPVVASIARQILRLRELQIEVAIVVGGGNFFRGVSAAAKGMDRTTADYMGMIATIINALALQDAMEKQGLYVRVQSAINMPQVAEPYIQRRAVRHLEKGRVVIFAAGSGNPYFSTDTAAALRANEIHAEALLKATKVDGIYDADPVTNPNAKKLPKITFKQALQQELKIMDSTAFSLCMDNKMPIIVFSLGENGDNNIERVLFEDNVGSVVL